MFGEAARSKNKEWLIKRIVWRMQANEEGDLSERAHHRAMELANDSDLRVKAPREAKSSSNGSAQTKTVKCRIAAGNRLPLPGTVLVREYKGDSLNVTVLPDGFEFEGEKFPSLSAVAKKITGSHWNGHLFFGLRKGGRR